jgi:integrase/recombinase XerD
MGRICGNCSFLTQRSVTDWRDLTSEDVSGFVAHLGEHRYASTSVARKIAALKSFTHYLMASTC